MNLSKLTSNVQGNSIKVEPNSICTVHGRKEVYLHGPLWHLQQICVVADHVAERARLNRTQ